MSKAATAEMRERTRSALSSLSSIEEKNHQYAQTCADIPLEVKEIGRQVLANIGRTRALGKEEMRELFALPILCADLLIDKQGVRGFVIAGRIDGEKEGGEKAGGPKGRRASGYRVDFWAQDDEALTPTQARASEVSALPLPEGRALFCARVSGAPKAGGRIGRLAAKIMECERNEQEMRSFWGGQPADFSLAWAALLWEDMGSLEGHVGKADLAGLESELGEGIRKKSLVIERDAGTARPDFSLCLPSYEVRFCIGNDGACRIRAIRMKRKLLFWKSERWIYKADGEEVADPSF